MITCKFQTPNLKHFHICDVFQLLERPVVIFLFFFLIPLVSRYDHLQALSTEHHGLRGMPSVESRFLVLFL